MAVTDNIKKLMDAGVHFGHLTRKWNPNMAPYIFRERAVELREVIVERQARKSGCDGDRGEAGTQIRL